MFTDPVIEEFKSFIIFFCIFGLAPFSENRKIRCFLYIYSVAQILTAICIFIFVSFLLDTYEENEFTTAINRIFIIGVMLTQLTIVVQAFCARDKQFSLLKKMAEADQIFQQKLNHEFPYRHEVRSIWFKFLAIGIFLFLSQLCFIYCKYLNPEYAHFWYPSFYSFLLMRVSCLQLLFYVFFMKNRLSMVNQMMYEFINDNCEETEQADFASILDRSNKIEKIFCLKQIYGQLFNINELINDSFGWSVLAIITQYFIAATVYGYWIFLAIKDLNIEDDVITIQSHFYLLLPLILQISVIANSCNSCTNISKSIADKINCSSRDAQNPEFNDLIREFSLQIAHEPIIISANGFFNIDYSLLGSIVATIATYLVILIQFRSSDDEANSI